MKPSTLGNTAAFFLVAAYLGAVLYQGNGNKLADELSKEGRFIEFLVAVYVLWFLVNTKGAVGKIAAPIVTIALVATALVWINKAGVMDAIKAWQSGNVSMFDALLKIFGADALAK
jgi:hypothetical protein